MSEEKTGYEIARKFPHLRLLSVFRIAIRILLRFTLGKARRDRTLKETWFFTNRTEIRDLIFDAARFFHSYSLLKALPHEREVQRTVRNMYGRLFVDIGTNIGFYSFVLNRNFERIIAVEPHPGNIREIERSAKAFGIQNIECVQKAVSDRNGVLPLFTSTGDGGHSLCTWNRKGRSIIVETVRLESLLEDIDRVDLVKVDVEGAEWQVLAGAVPAINKVKTWVIELHDLRRRRELESFLSSYGYDHKWLDYNHVFAWR